MHWLSKVRSTWKQKLTSLLDFHHKQQPAWGRSRELEIITRSAGWNKGNLSTIGDLDSEQTMDKEGEGESEHGRCERKVTFMPSPGE
jgi:hypothetical protein